MSAINDGGPAFACVTEEIVRRDPYNRAIEVAKVHHTGMSLRDWFAGQALGQLIIAANGHAVNRDDIANEAYNQADAMQAARAKGVAS